MEELDLTFVEETVKRVGAGKEKVLEILQAIQGHYGYLPNEALRRVCELTEITPASIAGVSTFYDQFRHRPAGKHIIHVCVGTACHVKGAESVYEAFRSQLGIPDGEDTDAQKLFTVERIACLGCCTLAPAVQIDDVTYGHLTRETVPKVLSDFLKHEQSRAASPGKPHGLRKGKADVSRRSADRARFLLRRSRQRQAARCAPGGPGSDRRRRARQAGRLRGHVPPDASIGDRAAEPVVVPLCPRAAGGRQADHSAAFRRARPPQEAFERRVLDSGSSAD